MNTDERPARKWIESGKINSDGELLWTSLPWSEYEANQEEYDNRSTEIRIKFGKSI